MQGDEDIGNFDECEKREIKRRRGKVAEVMCSSSREYVNPALHFQSAVFTHRWIAARSSSMCALSPGL